MTYSISDMIKSSNNSKSKSKSKSKHRVEWHFPTPMYVSDVNHYDDIQKEINRTLDTTKFSMNPDWGATHYLSDPSCLQNFIVDNNLISIKDEIDNHIRNYLKDVNQMNDEQIKSLNYVIVESWVTLFKEHNYAHIHNHNKSDISGVYYYKAKGSEGNIFFESPTGEDRCVEVPLEQGKIILFPGWLKHGVRTNTTKDHRMSLSFNINFFMN